MSVTAVPIAPLKRGSVTKLWIGIAGLGLVAAGFAWMGTGSHIAMDPASFLSANAAREGVTVTDSGLQIEVIREGQGARPGADDLVLVEYEGRLADGTVFDASARHGGPAPFPVSGVIPGWSEALQMMQRGGQYRLWIPPELGYGGDGAGGIIPPNAVLDFDVTLIDIAPGAALQMMQGLPGAETPEGPGGE